MPEGTAIASTLEADVVGPEGANRLIQCTGLGAISPYLRTEDSNVLQTWTFLVGPHLPTPQFRRATAFATLGRLSVFQAPTATTPTGELWHESSLESVEADWDDESTRTELRVEVNMSSGPGVKLILRSIRFTVTILAELP